MTSSKSQFPKSSVATSAHSAAVEIPRKPAARPLVCSYCNNTALYKAGGRGYCRQHYAQAVAASKTYGEQKRALGVISREKNLNHISAIRGGGSHRRKMLVEREKLLPSYPAPGLHRVGDVSLRLGPKPKRRKYDQETRPSPNARPRFMLGLA